MVSGAICAESDVRGEIVAQIIMKNKTTLKDYELHKNNDIVGFGY